VGLTSIDAQTEEYADEPCIIVSRFDREHTADGTVTRRIHQEDACQALNIDTDAHQRRGKYESHGGPAFRQVAKLLDLYAVDAVGELTQLAKAVAFTVAIGNADAHGKNLALLHDAPGQVRLAPLYDTVPTLLWPKLRDTAAMTVAGRSALANPSSLGVETIVAEARAWPLEAATVRRAVREMLEQLLAVAGTFDLPDRLADFVAARAHAMLRG
jgi:serine/threonine-protein kinase HipA